MTAQEIISIIQACGTSGVSSLKLGELDIHFNAPATVTPLNFSISQPAHAVSAWMLPEKPVEITPEEETEIKHKVEELTSVMKLSDTDLIDRLFPEPQDETEGVA